MAFGANSSQFDMVALSALVVERHATEVHEFVSGMPNSNKALAREGNWRNREKASTWWGSKFMEKDVVFVPPPLDQQGLPACRPRNQEAQGRHIDVFNLRGKILGYGGKGYHCGLAQTRELGPRCRVPEHTNQRERRGDERSETSPSQRSLISQHLVLCKMAKQSTRPYKGVRYKDPEHVKVCFQVTRRSKTSEAWKMILRERDAARKLWGEERIKAATNGDWQAYRDSSKKGVQGCVTSRNKVVLHTIQYVLVQLRTRSLLVCFLLGLLHRFNILVPFRTLAPDARLLITYGRFPG